MKTLKKISLLMFLLGGSTLIMNTGCQKYQDGPGLSLRSRTERVANTWKIDNYKLNETDYTSLTSGYVETYSKDGNFSFSWGSASGTGKWAFANDDQEIRITGTSNQPSQTLYILKLEEKQFWYYYMDGNDKKEFHLVEN
jgi:hypothetical protein